MSKRTFQTIERKEEIRMDLWTEWLHECSKKVLARRRA
jgi:hypothetical protein